MLIGAPPSQRYPAPPPGFQLLPPAPPPHRPHGRCPPNTPQASYAALFSTAVSAAVGTERPACSHRSGQRVVAPYPQGAGGPATKASGAAYGALPQALSRGGPGGKGATAPPRPGPTPAS